MAGPSYADARLRVARPGATAVIAAVIVAARSQLTLWRDRTRYRRALARMSERELADIGVNWSDIAAEASKPFWRT